MQTRKKGDKQIQTGQERSGKYTRDKTRPDGTKVTRKDKTKKGDKEGRI